MWASLTGVAFTYSHRWKVLMKLASQSYARCRCVITKVWPSAPIAIQQTNFLISVLVAKRGPDAVDKELLAGLGAAVGCEAPCSKLQSGVKLAQVSFY